VACRLCGGSSLQNVISLGTICLPGCSREIDHLAPAAPLELTRCETCGLLQLRHRTSPYLLWKGQYGYRSGINQTMHDALQDVVRNALIYHRSDGAWLDIGANDGTLLEMVPPTFTRVACEPVPSFASDLNKIADMLVPDFFKAETALDAVKQPGYNVITSAAVFYDVDDPNRFVSDIAKCLTPTGVWINQLSDTARMLRDNAFDNICHEHACYYDLKMLRDLYISHGLYLLGYGFNDVNGGSIRTIATKMRSSNASLMGTRNIEPGLIEGFVTRVRRWRQLMREFIFDSPSLASGELWCYGASTKGQTLLGYLDANERFTAVADRNPAKHGMLMNGSWLRIESEDTMRKAKPTAVLVLPWAFKREFVEREEALRAAGTMMLMPLPSLEFVL